MLNVILTIVLLAFLAGGICWSVFKRGHRKTRVRLIGVLAALAVAIVVTLVLNNTVFRPETILPWIGAKLAPEFMELLRESPTLCEVALGAVSGLITPILFFLVFILANFISWIVYLVVALICGNAMKAKEENTPYARPRTIAMAVAQTLVILVVCLIPVSAYSGLAPIVTDAITETGLMDESGKAVLDDVSANYIDPINENPIVNLFRVLGGAPLTDAMTGFTVNGTNVHLADELDTVSSLVCNVVCLTQKDFAHYGSAEENAIYAISDLFEDSAVLPAIAGELVNGATDAWKQDENFIGLDKGFLYVDQSGMFDSFITTLIDILNRDSEAGNEEALCDDLSTFAEVLVITIRGEVFTNLGESDAMINALSQKGVVNSIVTALGENNSMKVLIPEITNIGVRAIATTLGVKENVASVYDDMMQTIATGLNASKGKTGDNQIKAVSLALSNAFDEAGMAVDAEVLDSYSVTMIESLVEEKGTEEITAEDVKGFFAVYAWSVEAEQVQAQSTRAEDSTTPLAGIIGFDWKASLKGTVYEGKSDEELKKSGPAILARVNVKLSELNKTQDEGRKQQIREEANQIVQDEYADRLNDKASQVMLKATMEITVSEDSIKVTASMKSHTEMAKTTTIVTMEILLVDVQAVAENITAETIVAEANAIASIFGTAQKILEETSNTSDFNLETVGESVGIILDELSGSGTFGKEKTATLFTAILQSETVREAADMDVATATKMAQKGTEGDKISYTQTFVTVSKTVTVMESMNKNDGELTDEQIEELIRDINPQSAAMMEVYVTPTRMEKSYNMPARYSVTAAPLLSNMFHFMANEEMDDAQYAKESKALNNIMTLSMAARDNANNSSHNKTLFREDGIMGQDARATVDALMSSKSLAYSLRETSFEEDPFELSELMAEEDDKNEREELEQAMRDYYAENRSEENYETLALLAKLFGLGNIDTILGA